MNVLLEYVTVPQSSATRHCPKCLSPLPISEILSQNAKYLCQCTACSKLECLIRIICSAACGGCVTAYCNIYIIPCTLLSFKSMDAIQVHNAMVVWYIILANC